MKLRNKKTGEVDDFLFEVITNRIDLYRRVGSSDTKNIWKYNSLAELNKEWEDVEPAEPLIKDEKIRKAVRAWADASGIEKVTSYGDYWIGFVSKNTDSDWKFECNYKGASEFKHGNEYTIAELCGEEKE